MSRRLRMTLVLLLASTLATSAVLAKPLRSAVAVSHPLDFAAWLRSLLAGVWGKNGSQMDPNGNSSQAPASATADSDNGHQVDPDGR